VRRIAFVLILISLPSRADDFLPHVHRILFLGDSITHDGKYVADVETELLLHLPDRHFEIIDCGLSSETVSGLSEEGHAGGKFPRPDLHERLDRVLAKVKPDLVFACYGMNDGIYLPLSDERFAKFKEGMVKLHQKVEAVGAKIIHVTPPVFDPVPIARKVAPADKADANHPYEKYNDVLDAYGDWLLSQRQSAGWVVIDVHGPMNAAIAKAREGDPSFTFSGDGVHPNAAGHWLMAREILRQLPAPFESEDAKFGDANDPASLRAKVNTLATAQIHVLGDAWLTETGHKRPGVKPGLPLDEASAKATEMQRRIAELLNPK
jgi:lysophospholipase L1-like esterase